MKQMIAAAVLLALASGSAHAYDFGVGVKGGTDGLGVELSVGLTDTISARLSLSDYDAGSESETYTVGDDGNEGDIDAELDVNIGSTGLLFDWHVFNGGFHVTAGLLQNNGTFDLTGTLQDNIVIDGQAVDVADVDGDIVGEIELSDSFQPYFGIGYGRRAGDGGGLSFTAELGVVVLEPSASVDATLATGSTNFADQDEFEESLRDFEDDIEAELDDLEIWPVISVGVNYAF